MAMVGTSFKNDQAQKAIKDYPDRFFGSFEVDPNRGMEAVRELEAAVKELGVKAATAFPAGLTPAGADQRQEVLSDLREVRGARHPDLRVRRACPGRGCRSRRRTSALIDEVCWFFPELKFVTRHGCEPWADLAVKLMLKWPNLHYSTSAFAPKYYPKDVIHFANTRGADKVMYAGYFPMGLTPRPHLRGDARRARSATTSGRSSCARTRSGSSSSTSERLDPTVNEAFEAARAGGVIDTFLSMPAPRAEKAKVYDYDPQAVPRHRDAVDGDARGVHVQGRPALRGADDPVAEVLAQMDEHGIQLMMPGIHENQHARARVHGAPRPLRRHRERRPEHRAWRRCASSTRFVREEGAVAAHVLGHRPHPAGADQRQEDVPDLRQVRGARRADHRRTRACPGRAS